MNARELILASGLSKKDLLMFKGRYLRAMRKLYRDDEEPSADETLENYILFFADRCSVGMFTMLTMSIVAPIVIYHSTLDIRSTLISIVIMCMFIIFNLYINKSKYQLRLNIVVKLVLLRIRMLFYRVYPPKIS